MKTSRFFFSLFLFALSVSNAFSQVNELEIFIPLEEMECEEDDKTIPERDLYLFSILPEITYNAAEGDLSIISPYVTFESVTYYIMDANGIIIATDEIDLPKNVEQTIDISSLPNGSYFIILNIDERYFIGELLFERS